MWLFWIIVIIALLFVARVITHVIMKPIKRRRSDRQWAESKKYWENRARERML